MNERDNQIDIIVVAKRVTSRKKLFLKVSLATFAVACIIIFPVPRYYTSSVVLAPEIGDIMGKNSLSSLASSFGFNLGNSSTGDAIYPDLYPALINTNDFAINLTQCKVKSKDGSVNTTYYDYLLKHQKPYLLAVPFNWLKNLPQKLFGKKAKNSTKDMNLFWLTEEQDDILGAIRKNVTCGIDPKTGVINITVEDQDPLIAATIADKAMAELQNAITRYRTNKAKVDYEYYKKLTTEAKHQYEKARQIYGSYSDANMDVILESYKAKQSDLENDMQLKYNTYSTLNTQLQQAQAKVQENTPAFTIIKEASVPQLPAGPKRMIFVALMIILSWIVTTVVICKDLFAELFAKK